MQAEIPQSISGTPMRWGAFTSPQLGWLGVGAALPYLLLRWHLGPPLILLPSTPWLATALLFGFCRHEGRRLDAWAADWMAFLLQPHRLHHPHTVASARTSRNYVEVDAGVSIAQTDPMTEVRSLPWVAH
jgi:hypothetical protein